MTDYELEDTPCPKCDHYPIHSRSCSELGCDGGLIEECEDFDGYTWTEKCCTCNGMGIERWCPKCGYDISENPDNLAIDFGDLNDETVMETINIIFKPEQTNHQRQAAISDILKENEASRVVKATLKKENHTDLDYSYAGIDDLEYADSIEISFLKSKYHA